MTLSIYRIRAYSFYNTTLQQDLKHILGLTRMLDDKRQDLKNIICQDLKEISEINGESLDIAFKIWIIKNILHIDDDLTIEEILGYENRFNTDLFYEQQEENRDDYHMYWGKIFFNKEFEHVCNKNDIENFIKIPSNFESHPGDDKLSKFMQERYNENVKSRINQTAIFVVAGRLDEDTQKFVDDNLFESMYFGENVDVKIYQIILNHNPGDDKLSKFMQERYNENVKSRINQTAIFVVAGRLDEDTQKFVDDNLFESMYFGENVDVKIYQIDELFNEICMPTTPKLSIKYEKYHKIEGSITGHVKAKEIIENCEKYSKQIFLRNPRSFLNSTYTNKSISETLKDDTNKSIFYNFFSFNMSSNRSFNFMIFFILDRQFWCCGHTNLIK